MDRSLDSLFSSSVLWHRFSAFFSSPLIVMEKLAAKHSSRSESELFVVIDCRKRVNKREDMREEGYCSRFQKNWHRTKKERMSLLFEEDWRMERRVFFSCHDAPALNLRRQITMDLLSVRRNNVPFTTPWSRHCATTNRIASCDNSWNSASKIVLATRFAWRGLSATVIDTISFR